MRLWNRLGLWLRASVGRDRLESEMDSELHFHMEAYADDLVAKGTAREEAMRRARIEFGGIEGTKEECREARGITFLDRLSQDVRYALRTLSKTPGFTTVAVLTLALGIGANTAIFSVINSVLLQPLPFHDPNRLVRIYSERGTPTNYPVSGEDYFDWRAQSRSFADMSLFTSPQQFNASGSGDPETVSVIRTQANFFSVLGVQPELGREFAPAEDHPGNNQVVVLSFGFWKRHFAGTDALGKTVKLNFQPYTVIGVMPRTFNYPEAIDIWTPLEMSLDHLSRRGSYSYRILARLKPGITLVQAQADMTGVTKSLQAVDPLNNANLGARVVALKELLTGDSRPQLLVLLGAVTLVLLVACTNLANLLLVRATARQREIALRIVLGASRWRIVRQLLTESVALSCAGAAIGIAGASVLIRMAQSVATLPIPRENPVQLDSTVLVFSAGLSLLVGILFGLAPALEGSRPDLNEELKSSAGTVAGTSKGRMRLRNGLVIAEVAASLALLVGAGLLLRSFEKMRKADLGIRAESILTSAMVLPEAKYRTIPERRIFYERLLEGLERLPGTTGAAISQQIPLEGSHSGTAKAEGDPKPWSQAPGVNWNYVSPDYFRVFGIPFVSGRSFTAQELQQAAQVGAKLNDYFEGAHELPKTPQAEFSSVAVINRAMAKALWPGQEAVGKIFISSIIQPVTVIGVVGNEKYAGIRDPAAPEVYFPFTLELKNMWYPAEIVVRAQGAPESVLGEIRAAVHDLDSELSLFRVRSMEQVISDNMQDTSLQTLLLGCFAGLGLLLSAVGIYGVMAYMVAQRRHEMGLRMALGAQRSNILQLVLGRGARLTILGVAIGMVAALGLARLLSKELFGVTTSDPQTFIAVSVLLTFVALAACYIPARRAMKVDPMVALRYE